MGARVLTFPAPRREAPPAPERVRCSCGCSYSLEDWLSLPSPPRGDVWQFGSEALELRNCICRSTMARPTAAVYDLEREADVRERRAAFAIARKLGEESAYFNARDALLRVVDLYAQEEDIYWPRKELVQIALASLISAEDVELARRSLAWLLAYESRVFARHPDAPLSAIRLRTMTIAIRAASLACRVLLAVRGELERVP